MVRAYRRDRLLGQDVLEDFLRAVLHLDPALVASRPAAVVENTTPGVTVLEIIRQLCLSLGLHTEPAPADLLLERRYLGPLRKALMRHLPDDRPVRLSPGDADLVHEACLQDAQAIDAAFFADAPCFVAALDDSRAKAHAAAPAARPEAPLPAAALALVAECRARLEAALHRPGAAAGETAAGDAAPGDAAQAARKAARKAAKRAAARAMPQG